MVSILSLCLLPIPSVFLLLIRLLIPFSARSSKRWDATIPRYVRRPAKCFFISAKVNVKINQKFIQKTQLFTKMQSNQGIFQCLSYRFIDKAYEKIERFYDAQLEELYFLVYPAEKEKGAKAAKGSSDKDQGPIYVLPSMGQEYFEMKTIENFQNRTDRTW